MADDVPHVLRTLDALAARHPQYHREAYAFVLASLHETLRRLPQPRHVTGQELLDGLRRYALDQYGPMTRTVLQAWGVQTTEDIGEIVFALVEARVLGATPTDSKADFKHRYTFAEAFDRAVRYRLAD